MDDLKSGLDTLGGYRLLQHGRISYDKPAAETSVEELTEIMVSEYRKARAANEEQARS